MPKKKSSLKTPSNKAEKVEEKVEEEKPVSEQNKSASTPKKTGNEIDEIFAGKKRKKTDKPNGDEVSKPNSVKKKKKKKKNKASKEAKEVEGLKEPSSRPRKKTADGFTIYTEEELGINKVDAGNTPLCPFACDCCF